jgi:methylglyoxal reductase
MEELKEQGKVLEIGVCNVTLEQLVEYNQTGAVRYVQNRFSILDQEADRDVRRYCVEHGIGLIPYNVIEWGLLTNKILGPWRLREGDLRTPQVLPVFEEPKVEEIRAWVRNELVGLANAYGVPIEVLAIGWVINQPGVTVCLVGATSVEQIQSSLRARELLGNTELVAQLDAAYAVFEARIRDHYGLPVNEFLRNSYGLW